ncbi:hypothetical protein TrLO_g9398 [Triparma laevis f. longispina]|uniref:Uncharacterized protein n=1 Tax=Triparma laevis f. longispina TaxID=1714387 RepID=A0A9W7AGY2_9STRA|nr:hypothetical protein TrLO_g9398 [Triparma laevis f. longispina]
MYLVTSQGVIATLYPDLYSGFSNAFRYRRDNLDGWEESSYSNKSEVEQSLESESGLPSTINLPPLPSCLASSLSCAPPPLSPLTTTCTEWKTSVACLASEGVVCSEEEEDAIEMIESFLCSNSDSDIVPVSVLPEDQPEGVPESSLSSRTFTTPTTTDDSVSTSSSRRRLSAPTPDHSWDFRRCSDADLSPIYSYATSVTSHHSIYESFSLPASFKIETEITTGNTPASDGIFMAGNTGQCGNLYVWIASASNINFGVQCNSGSDTPISTPYTVKANTNYKIFAEYDSNTLIAKLTVIGDLEGYSGSTYTMEASKSFVGFPTDISKVGLGSGSLGSGCVFYVGDGVGDGEEHIGNTISEAECEALVRAERPTANGVTVSPGGGSCYAEFGMTSRAGSSYNSCLLNSATDDGSSAESFDFTGGGEIKYVKIRSATDTLAMNGATCTHSGISLDGSNDYVDIDDFEFGGPTSFEFYVKFDSFTNTYSKVFDFANGAGSDDKIYLGHSSTSPTIFLYVRKGSTRKEFRTSNFESSTWTHVVVTVSSTTTKIYKNGVLAGTNTDGHEPNVLTRTQHRLGGPSDSYGYFDGTIAYVNMWNGVELQQLDVIDLYAPHNTAHHFWDFRGCSEGSPVADLIAGDLAARPSGGPTCSADGLILDGINDYADIDDWTWGGTTSIEVYVKYDSFSGAGP